MVVRPAALPRGPGQHGGDRVHQPGVVVAGHQLDAGQAAGGQAAQERQPARAVLGAGHVDAEDLPAPVGVDAGRDQAVHVHRAAALADLLGQRVDPAERVRPAVQRPVPEGLHQLVQLRGHRADLRLRQARRRRGRRRASPPAGSRRPAGSWSPRPRPAPARPGGGAPGSPGSTTPDRSLGMASSIVPARVSHSRRRYPLRELTRSGVTSPYPALHADLDVGVHHPLGELPDHLPQQVRARRCQGLLELRAGNGHNVTCGHFALLRCSETTSKDREVAASHHGDTPYSGNQSHSVPVTPYTTSVDVNAAGEGE